MSSMKAVRIHNFGGLDTLSHDIMNVPRPTADEILVRLKATSVNPVDYKMREGKFPPVKKDNLPYILGRDVAGQVEAIGSDVTLAKVGDAIYAMPGFDRGTYAEYIVLKEEEFGAAPSRITLADAAAVPLAALTAWQGLFEHGKLEKGQRVLIHGGSGGVGHFAVQFAKAEGATVFATGSSDARNFLVGLGADRAIDYKAERFEEIANDIDLVLDLIGGETQERSWSILRRGGMIISSVEEPDAAKAHAAGALPGKRYTAHPSREDLTEIAALIDTDVVKVVIARCFDLDHVNEAQATLEKGGVQGKLLVTIGDRSA